MSLVHVDLKDLETFRIRYTKKAEKKIPNFAEAIAKRITGSHNQDFRVIVTGSFGKGKSTFCLYLGYRIAEEVAKRIGGSWQDYFNRSTIAIADEDEIKQLFLSLKNHCVYLLDDVGKAWGARNFMSELNRLFNDIFQLMRTARTCLIVSIASTFLVDKVPRQLAYVLVEMDQSLYNYGISTVKIKKIKHRPQFGDTHYPFYTHGRSRVVRHISYLPPEELMIDYVKERERVEIILREKAKNAKDIKIEKEVTVRDKILDCLSRGITKTREIKKETGASDSFIKTVKAEVREAKPAAAATPPV